MLSFFRGGGATAKILGGAIVFAIADHAVKTDVGTVPGRRFEALFDLGDGLLGNGCDKMLACHFQKLASLDVAAPHDCRCCANLAQRTKGDSYE